MSFDKHYPNRKDWRKPYRGPKSLSRGCRSDGSCPYCRSGREHADRRAEAKLRFDEAQERILRSPSIRAILAELARR